MNERLDGRWRTRAREQRQRTKATLRLFKAECRTSDSTWVCRQTCQPELDLPSPLAQGTFCLNARAAEGLGAPLGSGRAGPAVCPPGPGWKAQMSETKAISSYSIRARSSGFPALTGDRTCEFPEVCGSQNPGSTRLGAWWQWEVLGGTASP